MQRQRRDFSLGLALLLYQLIMQNDYIPPVTLGTIIFQIATFLGLVPSLAINKLYTACLQPSAIWYNSEWARLLKATVIHADDWHLYFNMVSFMWKGRRLERRFGSGYFAYLLVVFTILTSLTHVGLSLILGEYLSFGSAAHMMHQCAVGFSGVIFALKVLVNAYYPYEDAWIFGMFRVPSRYACWAELALIQIMVPNASFIGHLAGILVGVAYVYGPLKTLMDLGGMPGLLRNAWQPPNGQNGQGQRFQGHGTTGWRDGGSYPQQEEAWDDYSNPLRYNDYTAGYSEEDQIQEALRRSARDTPRPYRVDPSAPYETENLYPRL